MIRILKQHLSLMTLRTTAQTSVPSQRPIQSQSQSQSQSQHPHQVLNPEDLLPYLEAAFTWAPIAPLLRLGSTRYNRAKIDKSINYCLMLAMTCHMYF